jgi:hypothetical protein
MSEGSHRLTPGFTSGCGIEFSLDTGANSTGEVWRAVHVGLLSGLRYESILVVGRRIDLNETADLEE